MPFYCSLSYISASSQTVYLKNHGLIVAYHMIISVGDKEIGFKKILILIFDPFFLQSNDKHYAYG